MVGQVGAVHLAEGVEPPQQLLSCPLLSRNNFSEPVDKQAVSRYGGDYVALINDRPSIAQRQITGLHLPSAVMNNMYSGLQMAVQCCASVNLEVNMSHPWGGHWAGQPSNAELSK